MCPFRIAALIFTFMLCTIGICSADNIRAADVFSRFRESVAQLDGLLDNCEITFSRANKLVKPPVKTPGGGVVGVAPPDVVAATLGASYKMRATVAPTVKDSTWQARTISYNREKCVTLLPSSQTAVISADFGEVLSAFLPHAYTWDPESMYPRSRVLDEATISDLSLSDGRLFFTVSNPQDPTRKMFTNRTTVDAGNFAILQEIVYFDGAVLYEREYSNFKDVKGILLPYTQRRYVFDAEDQVKTFDASKAVCYNDVTIKEIKTDLRLDSHVFDLEIPDGYHVNDLVRGARYVQGSKTALPDEVVKSVVDDLVKNNREDVVQEARMAVTTDCAQQSPARQGETAPVVSRADAVAWGGGISVAIVFGGISTGLYWRARKRRAAG